MLRSSVQTSRYTCLSSQVYVDESDFEKIGQAIKAIGEKLKLEKERTEGKKKVWRHGDMNKFDIDLTIYFFRIKKEEYERS